MTGTETSEIESMSAVELIARLYRGAIDFVVEARATEDPDRRREGVARAVSILDALQSHLDLEAGGEIAANLSDLYDFARDRLSSAPAEDFDRAAGEAIEVLRRLGSGWEELSLLSAGS